MSVIIRLQNLPWSANSMDIRQYFKGLSIPEGGVHIVGGENGDAFIAFSTDEDARQAMMKDRGKINEVQVRLLLSSRAEMQKVIEIARQQSLIALQKAGAIPMTTAAVTSTNAATASVRTPQPPVITSNSLQNLLATQLGAAPSFQTYQQQAGITLHPKTPTPTTSDRKPESPKVNVGNNTSNKRQDSQDKSSTRDRRRSDSRERRRSRERDDYDRGSSGRRRRERSRSRDRERCRNNGGGGGYSRSTRRSRSRDQSRDRTRNSHERSRSNRNSRDSDTNANAAQHRYGRDNMSRTLPKKNDYNEVPKPPSAPHISPWSVPPKNVAPQVVPQVAPQVAPAINTNLIAAQAALRSNVLQAYAAQQQQQQKQLNELNNIRANLATPNAYTTASTLAATQTAVAAAPPKHESPTSNTAPPVSSLSSAFSAFLNYNTSTTTTNNYSVNLLPNALAAAAAATSSSNETIKPFALQNPYTAALRAANSNSNSQDSSSGSSIYSGSAAAQQALNTPAASSSVNNNKISSIGDSISNNSVFPGLTLNKALEALQKSVALPSPAATVGFTLAPPQQQVATQLQPTAAATTTTQPIAFADTNPYAQMYPTLFAQAAAAGTGIANPQRNTPTTTAAAHDDRSHNNNNQNNYNRYQNDASTDADDDDTASSIKISGMCPTTSYSDLRRFFSGLFIPHNGIKMVNDANGVRTGCAYLQFSRASCIQKAMVRNQTLLKKQRIKVEPVSNEEFQRSEDSFRPQRSGTGGASGGFYQNNNERGGEYGDRGDYNRDDNNRGDYNRGEYNRGEYNKSVGFIAAGRCGSPDYTKSSDATTSTTNANASPYAFGNAAQQQTHTQQPFNVLYIDNIPNMSTEQDIMKMFSAYTIYDMLLTPSAENRREITAYVKFSRAEEALAALQETARHSIGHRKVRARATSAEDMERAKEKLRLASEQLQKEEDALAEEAKRYECDDDDDGHAANETGGNVNDGDVGVNNANDAPGSDDGVADIAKTSIPSIFDLSSAGLSTNTSAPTDPRLRRNARSQSRFSDNPDSIATDKNNTMQQQQAPEGDSNFKPNFPHSMPSHSDMEQRFIILKNCDYQTRIDDVAELLLSEQLQLKHIEPLINDRNLPSGEFIVEFTNCQDTERAVTRFNNTQFAKRNVRVRQISPQEIANRIGKPFMNYFPGGGAAGDYEDLPPPAPLMRGPGGNLDFNRRGGFHLMPNGYRMHGNMGHRFGNPMQHRGEMGYGGDMGRGGFDMRRGGFDMGRGGFDMGRSGFDMGRGGFDMRRGGVDMRRGGFDFGRGGFDMGRGGGFPHRRGNDGVRRDPRHNFNDEMRSDDNEIIDCNDYDDVDDDDCIRLDDERRHVAAARPSSSSPTANEDDVISLGSNSGGSGVITKNNSMPEKFSRTKCVLSMQNVPFKAELKDIMEFFSEFKVQPEDIIRRFNDDSTPTGDARVAFPTPSKARAAYEDKKGKSIFNRTIYLDLV